MPRVNPKPLEQVLPPETYAELDAFIAGLHLDNEDERRKEALIQVLHKAQHLFGFLPEEFSSTSPMPLPSVMPEVSGVISFYNYFTRPGKANTRSTSAWVRRAMSTVRRRCCRSSSISWASAPGQVTEDGKFSIEPALCGRVRPGAGRDHQRQGVWQGATGQGPGDSGALPGGSRWRGAPVYA